MKKVRIVLASVLVIALSLSIAFSVYAQGIADYHTVCEEGHLHTGATPQSENNDVLCTTDKKPRLDNGASTRGTCDRCYGGSEPVCLGNMILMEEGYHTLGMIGLITTDCYAYLYGSYGIERCYECGFILWEYDGLHMCIQDHTKCWKGYYDVCFMVDYYEIF